MPIATQPFTPSELILLNGEKFSPASNDPQTSIPLLCSEGSVSGPLLAEAILVSAILANEHLGAIKLVLGTKEKFFGFISNPILNIEAYNTQPEWNGYTLESGVPFLVKKFQAMEKNDVRNIVYNLISENSKQAWQKVIYMVEWGLSSSNMLVPVQGEALKVFSTPFICPPKVKELASAQPIEAIRKLIVDCRKQRAPVWKLLMEGIRQAMADRSEK